MNKEKIRLFLDKHKEELVDLYKPMFVGKKVTSLFDVRTNEYIGATIEVDNEGIWGVLDLKDFALDTEEEMRKVTSSFIKTSQGQEIKSIGVFALDENHICLKVFLGNKSTLNIPIIEVSQIDENGEFIDFASEVFSS